MFESRSTKTLKRSQRRHHLCRMKKKARRVFNFLYSTRLLPGNRWKPEHNANHMASCSCAACGNPRRHFTGKHGLTRQEIKAMLG